MHSVIQNVIIKTPGVIEQVRGLVPPDFPAQIADSIFDGIKARSEQLKTELSQL